MAKKVPELRISEWADTDHNGNLIIKGGERKIKMGKSDGTGNPLVALNNFGADVIRLAAGKGFEKHTHVGDHILFVLKGSGFVEYNGSEHPINPGLAYLIPGEVEHGINAIEELVLLVVGNNYKALDSEERLILANNKVYSEQ
jgi:quercetin dioxygenase-like cupin family protein